jgi:hypothetical protein
MENGATRHDFKTKKRAKLGLLSITTRKHTHKLDKTQPFKPHPCVETPGPGLTGSTPSNNTNEPSPRNEE